MNTWLATFNEALGMYNAGIVTSIFGAFCVTFALLICWPKLVKDFGPIGGFLAAAFIIGTCWVINHKLPGVGFMTGLATDSLGQAMQFGLIQQGLRGAAPWVDMGFAIGIGFVAFDLFNSPKGTRVLLAKEAFPRWLIIITGGIAGGILAGLVGFTNAAL